MRIDFKRIEMQNFMSFAEEAFDFESCKGMNLVQGKNNDIPGSKNGAGKSNLFLALLYTLFGQLQSKIKNENLVNKYSSNKDMGLVLSFAVDGQEYKIRRGLAKGKTSYLELLKVDNGNEVDITKSTIPETQDFIEKDLLHCDVTIFLRTILLTADQTYNFYMLNKADKKEFVEKLFDISVFENMYKALHKDCLALDKASDACQNKLIVLNKNQEDYELRKAKHDESKQSKIDAIDVEVSSLEKKLEDARCIEVKTNDEVIRKLESAINNLQSSMYEGNEKFASLQSKISQIDLGLHKLVESKESRRKAIDKHKDVLEKLCKDCQKVFMKHYSLDVMLKEVKEIDEKKEVLSKSRESVSAQAKDLSASISTAKDKISKVNSKLAQLREEAMKASKAISSIEAKLDEARNRAKQIAREANPYDELVEKCKQDISSEIAKASKLDESLKYLKFAEGIVSQDTLRKFIIKDLVILLNNKIKTYLTKLGAKYYVEFDEDMDYDFITPGGSCEWSNFSAGERMRIMVATSFAFRDFMSIRNGLNANILVLDEYFDSAIDTLCVESILDILRGFSKTQDQNVFVISHRPEVSPELFDRTLLVEKTNGIASLKIP